MRLSLADSLAHIRDQVRGEIAFDEPALTGLVQAMRSGARFPLSTFGIYSELVLALLDADEPEQAQALLEQLVREKPVETATPGWRLNALDAPVHTPYQALYGRLMDSGVGASFKILPPPPDLATTYGERLVRSFDLMKHVMPDLAAEFNALVSDVLLVVGDSGAKYQFDGGSCYMLWGGLFLNATSHPDEVTMIEVMAHESAHMLLYACAADEALVDNNDDELFASPLRVDPRPMDGIYHATFVSARMHWAMSRLAESALVDEVAHAAAVKARDSDATNFWNGYAVVAQHGRLTATGQRVMASALDYMESQR